MNYQRITAALCACLLLAGVSGCGNSAEESSVKEETTASTKFTNAIVVPATKASETETSTKIDILSKYTKTTETKTETITETSAFDKEAEKFYVTESTDSRYMAVAYPQFPDSRENADALNSAIRDFIKASVLEHTPGTITSDGKPVEKKFNGTWGETSAPEQPKGIKFPMTGDYTITRLDGEYISLLLKGNTSGRSVAFGIGLFSEGLILDAKTGKTVTLSDLYNVDAAFAKLVREKYEAQEGEKLNMLDDFLLESLKEYDTKQGRLTAFLAEDAVVLHLPAAKITKSDAEIRIPYAELAAYKK